MTRQEDCTAQMREIYAQYSGEEIANSIKLIRSELTTEELRNKHQIEFLRLQALISEK